MAMHGYAREPVSGSRGVHVRMRMRPRHRGCSSQILKAMVCASLRGHSRSGPARGGGVCATCST